jgi:putative hydrolase of the HAD superfamily
MDNIKNFIFDFGGVLYEIDHQKTLKAFASLSTQPDKFTNESIKTFSNDPSLIAFEKGDITIAEFRDGIRESMHLLADDVQIDLAWNKTLIELYYYAIPILTEIKKLGNIVLMSNTNILHYNHFEPECRELFSMFDKTFFSFKIGKRKPDEDFFKHVLNKTGFNPKETLFIDDSYINIQTAEHLDIKTFHVYGSQTLSDLLHSVK